MTENEGTSTRLSPEAIRFAEAVGALIAARLIKAPTGVPGPNCETRPGTESGRAKNRI